MSTPTAQYIIYLLKYTAIVFPLVSYTNETCGLFLFVCFVFVLYFAFLKIL